MFVLKNFLFALARILDTALWLYMWIIIIRVVLSWVRPDPYNPIVQALYAITEPVLSRLRRRLPLVAGGIDFSPIIVIFAIVFLQIFLVQSLRDLAASLP
jgi:YggT family protein